MTDMDGLLGEYPQTPPGGRRAERQRRRGPGCLIAFVILAVLAGAGYWGATNGIDRIKDQFSSAEDYSGAGNGTLVSFEVKPGDTVAEMGRGLKAAGVVASVEAFMEAARNNPRSNSIQAGFYAMQEEMSSEAAVAILVDPSNIVTTNVVIPEGFSVQQIVARLAKNTDYSKAEFVKALEDPELGLPDGAGGNPEGYLFPATYQFGPNATPVDMLRAMVVRWEQVAQDADLEAKAEALGYSVHEIMTIASLIEAEGRGSYRPQIARVIYNRLEIEPNPAAGYLQIDAAVNYALDKPGPARLTQAEIDSVADSPYNTYTQKGLPPGPIEAPGADAIQAALNPAEGPWFFYVTVNLATGETKFTESYNEFLGFKRELDEYCRTQSERC